MKVQFKNTGNYDSGTELFQEGASRLLPVFSVIASITALQSIVIFVVIILVVFMYCKRKDTPRAANVTGTTTGETFKVEEQLYEAVEAEEKPSKYIRT